MADGTYRHTGMNLDYVPASATTAKTVVEIEDIIGVVIDDVAANATGAIGVKGVYALPKSATTVAIAQGVKLYWDASNDCATETALTNKLIGYAAKASATTDTTVDVQLVQTGIEQAEQVGGVTYTIGTEAANVINVACQFTDENGADLAVAASVRQYLSSVATGLDYETGGPDAVAIGTDGSLYKSGGDSLIEWSLISEADGDADINITKSGADTFYLVTVLPNGRLVVSGAITFDATT